MRVMKGEISIWFRYSCCKALYKQHFVAVPHTDTHSPTHICTSYICRNSFCCFFSFEMFLAIFLLCVAGAAAAPFIPFLPSFLALCKVHCPAHTHTDKYTDTLLHTHSQWLRTVRFFKWLAAIAFVSFAFCFLHSLFFDEWNSCSKRDRERGSDEWGGVAWPPPSAAAAWQWGKN